MTGDPYQILDLAKGANDAEVRRAYRKAIARIEADTALTDNDRRAANAQLDDAFRTLTDKAQHVASPGSGTKSSATWAVAGGALIAAIGLGGYWKYQQGVEAAARERVVAEQAEAARVRELAERADKERQRIQDEIRAQKEAEEKARSDAIQLTQEEMKKKVFTEDDRPEAKAPVRDPYQRYQNSQAQAWDERNRNMEEQRQRWEDERNSARARAETERQKRYLEDRMREDELARLRREANARGIR